jgi:IS4 transposase
MSKQKQSSTDPSSPKPLNTGMLDLYTDYLTCSFGLTTATGMSAMLDGAICHDDITRFLAERDYTNKDLWKLMKPTIREIETDDGVIVIDDTIEEKQYTDENGIIAWHYDHVFQRSIKGVNQLNVLYHNDQGTVPLGFEIIKKDLHFTNPETEKLQRKSSVTKNELARSLIGSIIQNQVKFRYCLADSWFSSKENMEFIVGKKKHFVFALKSNRTFVLSKEDKLNGTFIAVSDLPWEENTTKTGYLRGMDMPLKITRQIFTNEDNSIGILYLVTSDLTLEHADIITIYQKRWNVETYHKSMKSNLGFAKSPTKRETTQRNHFFAVAYGYHKLERLARATKLNHFALKTKLYIKAQQASMQELVRLRAEVGMLA